MKKIYCHLIFYVILMLPVSLAAQLTQSLAMQNGFPMPKGEIYWQNGLGLYNHFTAAPTKNFSFGVGILPVDDIFYTFSLKFAAELPNRKLSAGLCFHHSGSVYSWGGKKYWDNSWAVSYGVVSLGTRRNNFSVMAGTNVGWREFIQDSYYPINFKRDEDNLHSLFPFFGVTIHQQGRHRTAFVMDNYFFKPEKETTNLILMPALRNYWRGFALDLAFGTVMEWYRYEDYSYWDAHPVPWVSFFVPFRRNKEFPWFRKL